MSHDRSISNRRLSRHCLVAAVFATATIMQSALAVELNEGDILVADNNQNILIAIDPLTAEQTVVVPSGNFNPDDVEVEPDGGILVSDAFDDVIYRVDPETGGLTPVLADGTGVTGLGVSAFGEIFVPKDVGAGSDAIFQVDPVTGDLTTITSGGFLSSPDDIAAEANGDLLVLDAVTTSGKLIRVDRDTGGQIVVATDGGARQGNGIAIERTGTVVVASAFEDGVVRIDPDTGDQTVLTAEGALGTPGDVAVDIDDSIVVTDTFSRTVSRVDPVTGDVTLIASGGFLVQPGGVAIYRTGIPVYECAGFAAPADAGPISVTQDGTLLLRSALLNVLGQPVTGADLSSAPAIQIVYDAQPSADTPSDVTDSLLGPLPFFQGNDFIFRPGIGQWLHGQQTGELSARGVYTLSMVSGDWSEYRIAPSCEVRFVRE